MRIAERYDLAIMSTKGLSITAARLLVDHLCAEFDLPLLVLHDFDKSGFSIVGTLRRDPEVHVPEPSEGDRHGPAARGRRGHDLQTEASFEVRSGAEPAGERRHSEEIEFLLTRRVELNAFASADFVAWIERKLEQHGVAKVVPDDATLTLAYRRSAASYIASLTT